VPPGKRAVGAAMWAVAGSACGGGTDATGGWGRGTSTIIHLKLGALLELHFYLLVHPCLAMEDQVEALLELLLAN
jgi:hypothetical protein